MKAEFFARIPLTLLADESLTDFDVRVYACIALKIGGGDSWSMPQSEIQRMARGGRRSVQRSLRRLIDHGHLVTTPGPHGALRYARGEHVANTKEDVPSTKAARGEHVGGDCAVAGGDPDGALGATVGSQGGDCRDAGGATVGSHKQDHQEPSKIIQEEMSDQVVAPAQGADAPAQVGPELRKRLRDEARERIRALGSDPREKHRRPYGDPGTA